MRTSWRVRDADPDHDAGTCAAVYAPYVRDTAVSFELDPPDEPEMGRRILAAQEHHAWLVLIDERAPAGPDMVVGYAYGGPWRARPAYRFTCEVSVYLAADQGGRGGGRTLYAALLDRLSGLGFHTVIGGMTEPNPASAALHRALDFAHAGTVPEVGHKFGRWHDVTFYARRLEGTDTSRVGR